MIDLLRVLGFVRSKRLRNAREKPFYDSSKRSRCDALKYGNGIVGCWWDERFDAVTQIQEQTLVFVPKILAMVAITVALFSWITVKMMEFSAELFSWSPVSGS